MNKMELIQIVADQTKCPKKDAETMVNTILETIIQALMEGDKVQLMGFGSFEVKTRASRVGRNPKTGLSMEIPETRLPVFKAGKALKDAVMLK